MKRVCSYAKVTSISDEFLRESNKELGLERAQLRFQFVGGSSAAGASALIADVDTSNGGSKLIDLSSQEGNNVAQKCAKLLAKFNSLASATKEEISKELDCRESDLTDEDAKSYRFPKFTVYTFTISDLTDGTETVVNNGERNYSTMSTTYLNEHNDSEEALRIVKDQLQKRINDGDYAYGEV